MDKLDCSEVQASLPVTKWEFAKQHAIAYFGQVEPDAQPQPACPLFIAGGWQSRQLPQNSPRRLALSLGGLR